MGYSEDSTWITVLVFYMANPSSIAGVGTS